MKIIFFGDIVGKAGIEAIRESLDSLKGCLQPDFLICNAENVSKGKGILFEDYKELVDLGFDAITLGNHYHSKKQIDNFIKYADKLIRPLNLLTYEKGEGSKEFIVNGIKIRVTNILCKAFMKEEVTDPINSTLDLLKIADSCIHILDLHGESTSEKTIFANYFDGKITAVLGTHTHVQTNDEIILPNGTAFMCDVGMCGNADSVIGFNTRSVINQIVYNEGKMYVDDSSKHLVNAIYLEVDNKTFKTTKIYKIRLIEGKEIANEPLHL